jgi:hypothetical protein
MLDGSSRSTSMRCEVDFTSEALGLKRFTCFTGRRSAVENMGDAENTGYVRFRLLSIDEALWVCRRAKPRLEGEDRCWCMQCLCAVSTKVLKVDRSSLTSSVLHRPPASSSCPDLLYAASLPCSSNELKASYLGVRVWELRQKARRLCKPSRGVAVAESSGGWPLTAERQRQARAATNQ